MSPAASGQTAFVTGVLTLDTLRNDFNGWLGMKFTVGPSPITITDLGRYCISGNGSTHTVKLVNATTGASVPGGSVPISLAGATAGQFKYAALATPIDLAAGSSYYLVSQEIAGGDRWATALRTAVTTTAAATCDGAILSNGAGWTFRVPANHPFVPLSFKYTSGAPPANQAPFVNAGPDQTITLPISASLAGTATDDGLPNSPGALAIQWSQVSGPGTAAFANANLTNTTVSFSQAGTYVLRLSADDSLLSATDDITVTVNPVPPVNQAPIVNAGPDQTITLPSSASLSGSGSDDGLPNPPTLTFQWSKVSGPGTATFANANVTNTTVSFSQSGTYVLRLSAGDSLLSATDDITVTVNSGPPVNQAPIVNAGPDQTITLPSSASLSGSGSDDGLPNPPTLTFQWSKVSGPGTATFANANVTNTTVSFSQSGTYVLRLSAGDSLLSATDDITVTVNSGPPVNQAPVVDAGPDQTITLPSSASLSGSGSDDGLPNPSTLTFQWSKVSGPGTATFANANVTNTVVSFSQSGVYVLRLSANDSLLSTADDITITVNPIQNQLPPGLVGYWRLDDATGTGASDSSGNNNQGSLVNGPTWATGKIGGGLSFDGVDDYVNVNNSGSLNPVTQITLSAWIRPTGTAASGGIISKENNANNNQYYLRLQGGGKIRFTVAGTVLNGTTTLSANTWYLVTGTYDGSSMKVYVNGVLEATATATLSMSDNGLGVRLGARQYVTPLTFNGLIDDVRIYNRALILAEVQALLNPTPPVNQPPVVNAGLDQTITLPSGASLTGSANDDGLPNPPASLTLNWSQVSGPGTATFANASAASTTASFSQAGTYVLRLSANDSLLSTADDITVTVNPVPPVNQFPVANAGPDQTITLPGSASLTGSAIDDGLPNPPASLTFHWSQVSGPGTATFGNVNAASTTASFSLGGTYVLRLSANDSLLSATDDITVTVNQPPTANAGPDQTITLPSSASLSGSALDDGLPSPPTLTLQWSQVSGPGTATFANANTASTTVSFSQGGTYVLRLSANDSLVSATDDVIVTVNQPPMVNAGPDQTLTLPSSASLVGSALDDGLPSPPMLTLQWSQVSGPGTATFVDASAASTTVSFSQAGTYGLRLSANDSLVSTTDDITVTVNPANQAPVVDAGPDQTITLPAGATLSGTVNDDGLPNPPGTPTVQWSQISGLGTANFANANSASTTVTFSQADTYVLRLKANDGEFVINDDIMITVNPAPNVPPQVAISSPADNSVYTSPANITITAGASDSDGSITLVQFFANGTLIGSRNSPPYTTPYTISWNGVGGGTYSVTAAATDNGGAIVTSVPIDVIVNTGSSPANDNFANAQVISGAAGNVTGNNLNATPEPGEPFHAGNNGNRSVWYEWTASTSSQTLVDTIGSTFDTTLAVYIGPNVSSLDTVGSNNDIDQITPQSRLSFTSIAGTTYLIAIDGFNGDQGNIVLNWAQTAGPPPPANDGFATAPALIGGVGAVNGSSANATKEPGEPNHAGNPGGSSVWYQWVAPTSNSTVFDTLGTTFDTLLAVYTGDSVADLTEIASNNDLDSITRKSRLTFTAIAGTNYFIAIDGTNGVNGNYLLSWNQAGFGLPDLIIRASAASNFQITNQTFLSTDCAVVEGLVQAGARKLLVFTTETHNVGTVDWYVGNPNGNPAFIWAPCHGHYHFNDYMQYRLLDSAGNLVAPGYKVGFCLTDSMRWDPTANPTPKYHCGLQGIQKGWADVYTFLTPGQWIDITGVPDGYYTLEQTVNPLGRVQESDYSNNTVVLPITIGTPHPPNDNFTNAQILTGTSGAVTGLSTFGTKESGEPNHAGNAGGHSVWYRWTAVNNQAVIFDTLGSSINTLLAVYTGSAVNGLTLVASNDDLSPTKLASRVIFNPIIGTAYQIAVDGYNGGFGNITLNWNQSPPPANDNFANAQAISGGAGTVTTHNLLATKETGEPNHAGNAGGHSLWFQWSAPATGSVTIDTLGSDFDTLLAVYTGNAYGSLTTIAFSDDIGGGGSTGVLSRVTFNANLGTSYKIAVDGYGGKQGYITLNWNEPNGIGLGSAHRGLSHPSLALAKTSIRPALSCTPISTGGFLLGLLGEPNQIYTIDFSTDLVNWTYLYSLQADSEGTGLFVDRSKPAGRVNLLDPWCGADDKVYTPPVTNQTGIYYRAMSHQAAAQASQ